MERWGSGTADRASAAICRCQEVALVKATVQWVDSPGPVLCPGCCCLQLHRPISSDLAIFCRGKWSISFANVCRLIGNYLSSHIFPCIPPRSPPLLLSIAFLHIRNRAGSTSADSGAFKPLLNDSMHATTSCLAQLQSRPFQPLSRRPFVLIETNRVPYFVGGLRRPVLPSIVPPKCPTPRSFRRVFRR